jgi:glycolate oxidase FAD binding subunit
MDALVATPGTVDEAAGVLRDASANGLAVVPRGAGTKLDWGGTPVRVDVILDSGRLAGVRFHTPGDLVVSVGAGTPLRDLQTALAQAGQRLALDPASAATGGTVGGVLSTGEAGPLRLRYGSGRDLLIGVEFVRADGVVAHAGGRVVKNVAGYDLGKLLCGAFGTLGFITSATFRLHPMPASQRWICRRVSGAPDVGELLASPVVPSAVEVDLPMGRPGVLGVLLEGSESGVDARAAVVARLLGGDGSTMDSPPAWWGRYPSGDVLLKVVAPVASLHLAVRALSDVASVRGSAGAGVVFAGVSSDVVAGAIAGVRAIPYVSCVVLSAPPSIRDSLDVWGPVPGLSLMRRVKDQFDPKRLLAPGRFVGGI